MSKKKKPETVSIEYQRALNVLEVINPTKMVQGRRVSTKSKLSSIKGDTGMHVYHFKHDIKDACKPYDDKKQALLDDLKALRQRLSELQKDDEEDERPKKVKKKEEPKEKDEFSELSEDEVNKRAMECLEEIETLQKTEIEVALTKGKFKLSNIKDAIDADEREILKFVIIEDI